MRITFILSICVVSCAILNAQQVGDSNRNYGINGQGFNNASPVQSVVVDCNYCNSWVNEYFTNDSDAPVIWAAASGIQLGWSTTATNSVDIGPAGLGFLLDGTSFANPLAPFSRTDANGTFRLSFATPPGLKGANIFLGMAHVSPTSPDGFYVSQAHDLRFDALTNLGSSAYVNPTSGASTLSLSDDGSALRNIGFSFPLYGTTYTQVYVNANGNLTFGAASSDWTETPSELRQGPRRIAGWWDDINPAAFGEVRTQYTSTSSTFATTETFKVWYHNVPELGGVTPLRFSITLRKVVSAITIYSVYLDYEAVSRDGIIGIGRGVSLFPSPLVPVEFSQVPLSGLSGDASYYEQFDINNNPADVMGHQIRIFLDSTTGQPSSIN